MTWAAAVLVVCAGALIVWTWLLYPLTVAALASLGSRPRGSAPATTLPTVSVIVAAHNEEAVMEARLLNLLAGDYPPARLDVVVASDHSTDRTVEIARRASPRVRVIEAPGRGKSLAQNHAIDSCTSDIIVLTDADTTFAPDCLRRLVAAFDDPRVGCAVGNLRWTNQRASAVASAGALYWRFEHWLWRAEERLGILAYASGACMAVRRTAFEPMDAAHGDDCVIPLSVVAQGLLVRFADRAGASESRVAKATAEFRARARMTLRGTQATLALLPRVARYPLVGVAVVSHKLLRWSTPVFLLLLFAGSAVLAWQGHGRPLFAMQAVVWGAALLGALGDRAGVHLPLASHAHAFAVANAGMLVGVVGALRRRAITAYTAVD